MTPPASQSDDAELKRKIGEIINERAFDMSHMPLQEDREAEWYDMLDEIIHLISQSQAAAVNTVLDRVEKEFIGEVEDKDIREERENPQYAFGKHDLRTRQRQILRQLRQEQGGRES